MNVNDLTMRQMREVQKALNLPGDELTNDPFGLQAGLAWQVKKANGDKDFTFEQALDLTAEQVAEILGVEIDAPLEK